VAALTSELVQAASAARSEAQQLRLSTQPRRLEMRRRSQQIRRLETRCRITWAWLSATRMERRRSPWSELPWRDAGAELDGILVPLDGGA